MPKTLSSNPMVSFLAPQGMWCGCAVPGFQGRGLKTLGGTAEITRNRLCAALRG
jgi:hypothetical protein